MIGWSGVGSGTFCSGPSGGVNTRSPTRVATLVWKPLASWYAVARDVIARIESEPRPLWATVSCAISCVEWDATTPSLDVVHTRVLTPDAVPSPGSVASATLLVRDRPAWLVQPMTWYPVVEEPAGI